MVVKVIGGEQIGCEQKCDSWQVVFSLLSLSLSLAHYIFNVIYFSSSLFALMQSFFKQIQLRSFFIFFPILLVDVRSSLINETSFWKFIYSGTSFILIISIYRRIELKLLSITLKPTKYSR